MPEEYFRDLFEWSVQNFNPQDLLVAMLCPWLETLSLVSSEDRDWAVKLADETLISIRDLHAGRDLASPVCLFYSRNGKELQVQEWLEWATCAESPVWQDHCLQSFFADLLHDSAAADFIDGGKLKIFSENFWLMTGQSSAFWSMV